MTKFTGYARNRGFREIPVFDKSKKIQERSQSTLRDMETAQKTTLANANQHLQDLRDKHQIEQDVRRVNEQIRREYASAYIDAYQANADAQIKAQQSAISQQQAFTKELLDFSNTLKGFADQQFEKRKEDELNQANVLAAKVGLTAEQFQQLKTLEGVLQESERQNAPIYQEMLKRGATAEELNTIISSTGYQRYQFAISGLKQTGVSLERYLDENGDTQIDGYSTTLNAAKRKGIPEYNDILQRLTQDFVTQNLAGFDPAFIAEYAKPSMDRTLARRQDSARKQKERIDVEIYDGSQRQLWSNLASEGADAFIARVQDLTGPDKRNFRPTVERNIPYWIEMLETGNAPDGFVDALSEVKLKIGNQPQAFGSLHDDVFARLRIAERKGKNEANRAIQAEQEFIDAETDQTMRAVFDEMNLKAINGELTYANVMATIQEMRNSGQFSEKHINTVKAFLPKTPSGAAAKMIIDQWNLRFARDNELPEISEINSSPLTPDQKLKWFDKRRKEVESGFTQEYKSRRNEFLKTSIMRELNLEDVTETTWTQLDPSVHNLYYKLQKEYDDLYGSDLTQDENTRHENSQKPITLRLPSGGSDKPFYSFDGEGFTGKVKALSLPQSPPSVVTRTSVQEMLKDGNENKLYTQQIVPVSIIDNYLNNLRSGKRVQMPEAFKFIAERLGVPPRLVLEAQMDVATAQDKKERKVMLPQSAEAFYKEVEGTPNSTISKYIQSRYHSRNRASRALVGSGLPDFYTDPSGFTYAPQSHTDALIKAGNELGVDPLDIATLFGFETAATYSPSKWGGDGNNYLGLIQFGPEEQKKYGVTENMTFEEQLVAVVQFFKDRFAREGMSTQGATLLQLYTTVLAGNPKANIHLQDAFGTSAHSGVKRMQKEHREQARRRYFSGIGRTNPWSHPSTISDEAREIMERL